MPRGEEQRCIGDVVDGHVYGGLDVGVSAQNITKIQCRKSAAHKELTAQMVESE